MAKRARQKTQHNTYNESIVVLDNYRKRRDNNHIFPRNPKQKIYDRALYNPAKNIVVSVGPAGTGKTLLAVTASIESLRKGNARKIVITRPAVSVDEQHGFLPGTLQQKMEPWTRPIFDVFEQYWAPSHIEAMVRENIIEIAPLAYMRGRTFKDCWIIADEMQNATRSQMKMLCTRIGENTKLVITGDLEQHDRGYEDNGLKHFIKLINAKAKDDSESLIDVVTFVPDEIERHVVVEEIIKLYND